MKVIDIYNGKTKAYGIMGNPVTHSFSPILQNTIAALCGENSAYLPFTVEKGSVKKALEGAYEMGFEGFNITVPHKVEVMESLCDIDALAQKVGAVNTVKRTQKGYKGYNTDILGLGKVFDSMKIVLDKKTVVVLGAGGAAKAAVVMAAEKKAGEIYIVNRTVEKAQTIAHSITEFYKGKVCAIGYDKIMDIEKPSYVINTTSAGMGNGVWKSVVEDTSFFKKVEALVDIVYVPWETKIIHDAKQMGCVTANGFNMLIYQGIASYEIWHDTKISAEKSKEILDTLTDYYRKK